MSKLFESGHAIINVGLLAFRDAIAQAGGSVVQVEWAPPAGGDRATGWDLARLTGHPAVERANALAYANYLAAQPMLIDVDLARNQIAVLRERVLLHAGPPIAWAETCGPMQGAAIGAVMFEGWAANVGAARKLLDSGGIAFESTHDHATVGPMAGVVSPSMPVWVVENASGGNRAYCTFNEGLGKALRFGAHSAEVIKRLQWMAAVMAPALKATLAKLGPLELKPMMAQALQMGDELHNRNAAASSLLLKQLVPAALRCKFDHAKMADAMSAIAGNDHFFLNLSMAACKAMLDAAHNVPDSSMVTAMSRNGVRFGIRLSGTGARWFEASAPIVHGLYFPTYGPEHAAPDMGDSSITETAGLGGFAMATAPAIVQFVGGTPDDAIANTREMTHITLGRNNAFTLPAMNFTGTPAGIDARKVLDTNILPIINTGIAHREAGVGQIGAGITRAPLECFAQAIVALASSVAESEATARAESAA
ncbi:MAG: DUF1116 domain-containing protein [Betaproteobacteria bacterium]